MRSKARQKFHPFVLTPLFESSRHSILGRTKQRRKFHFVAKCQTWKSLCILTYWFVIRSDTWRGARKKERKKSASSSDLHCLSLVARVRFAIGDRDNRKSNETRPVSVLPNRSRISSSLFLSLFLFGPRVLSRSKKLSYCPREMPGGRVLESKIKLVSSVLFAEKYFIRARRRFIERV